MAGAIFGLGTFVCTNLVKSHQAILLNKFHTSVPSSSGEDFSVFFIFEHKAPCHSAILDHGATI